MGNITIVENKALDGNGAGLSIVYSEGIVQLYEIYFYRNQARYEGGGIYIHNFSGILNCSSIFLRNNDCKNKGAGIYGYKVGSIII